jgi:hypothetical protein
MFLLEILPRKRILRSGDSGSNGRRRSSRCRIDLLKRKRKNEVKGKEEGEVQ